MLNKVMLIGNLGKDPESFHSQGGAHIVTLSVATSKRRKGRDGQYQDETTWHTVKAFNKLADTCVQYLQKGSKIFVEGEIATRQWTDQQSGQTRYATEILAENVRFLDSRAQQ